MSNFAGINRTAKFHNISSKKAQNYLSHIKTHTLHRPYRKPKYRNPFYAYIENEYLQMDLVDLVYLEKENNGMKYLLTAVDTHTRKGYAVPLKNKKGQTIKQALEAHFIHIKPKIRCIITDSGTEFVNKHVKELLIKHNIRTYQTRSELKAAICEAFNKTLQRLIFKYMTHNKSYNYVHKIKEIVSTYNNSPHSFFKEKLSPNDASLNINKIEVLDFHNQHYMKFLGRNTKKFKIGDRVRIRKFENPFAKGYRQKWTDEIFIVVDENKRLPIPMYSVVSVGNDEFVDNLGESPIEGYFYANELTRVSYMV